VRLVGCAVVAVLCGVSSACERTASDTQLAAWLEEANSANAQRRDARPVVTDADWGLQMRGSVRGGAVDFSARQLADMATTHVHTTNPNHTSNLAEVLDYRGITLAQLLDASGATDVAGDMTIIAADGYLQAQSIAEARRAPIMIALEENGVALTRNHGGPLLQVFPYSTHPETRLSHPEGGAFYVTCIIVGTEPLAVRVGKRTLHAADLEPLTEHTFDVTGGFRYRWPSAATKVHGFLLRDVLKSAGVTLHPGESVVIGRKPRTSSQVTTTVRAEDVLSCDILLGVRYGDDRALLPSILGGPAVVAFPPSCLAAASGKPWPEFVESIEVSTP